MAPPGGIGRLGHVVTTPSPQTRRNTLQSGSTNGLNARWSWRNQGSASVDRGVDGWLTIVGPP